MILLQETKLAGKRRAPSNAASKPSKSQKSAAIDSPCESTPLPDEGAPSGASSGSPSSKARALKGKKRAEPTGKNVSTRGMGEAEAIATVKQRIVKFGNLYLGAVKVRSALLFPQFRTKIDLNIVTAMCHGQLKTRFISASQRSSQTFGSKVSRTYSMPYKGMGQQGLAAIRF